MLGDFQRALADMTLDARLAAAVRVRGSEALAGYALSALEARRLEAVARQDGMSLNCSLARANRFGSIHDAFPMTCVLLGPQLRGVLDDLWSRRAPDNYQLTGEEMAFAALVEGVVASGAVASPYLDEVFRYERACWDLALEVRLRDPATLEGCTRTCRFRHDPAAVLDALGRHEMPPPGLPRTEYLVNVRVSDGDIVAEWTTSAPEGLTG